MEVLVRGSHAILQADKASDLGYEGGNVEVSVMHVRHDDATCFIGFPDGREAWVNAEYLRPAKAGDYPSISSKKCCGSVQIV